MSCGSLAQQEIWLTSIQPFTGGDWDAGISMRVGAEIMLEEINAHSTLLGGFELKVVWQDSECTKSIGTNLFMANIFDSTYESFAPGVPLDQLDADGDGTITTADTAPMMQVWTSAEVNPPPVGLLGTGCSGPSLGIASTAWYARMPMVSNSATRPDLSDRSQYPNFFRTILPDTFFNGGWFAMVRVLGFTTCTAIIGETENWATMGVEMVNTATNQGVTMRGMDLSSEIPGFYGMQVSSDSQAAAREAAAELVRLKERFVILIMYEVRVRLVICEAHKAGIRNAVYMPFGWLAYGWWTNDGDTDCTADELTTQATGFISANMMFWRDDRDTVLSCSETMTSGQFQEAWYARQGAPVGDLSQRPEGYKLALEAATMADAVCMYAQMLHEVLVTRGRALSDLSARTSAIYNEIFDVLTNTDFEGVQGRVRYAPGSADPKGFVILQQMQAGGVICDVASYNEPTLSFFGLCDLVFGYPGETYHAGPSGASTISASLNPYATCPSDKNLDMATNTCEDCPAGRVYLSLYGECACQAGTVPNASVSGGCELCGAGTISASPGQQVCSSCEPGWFSGTAGSTACFTCPLGSYSNEVGASACSDCPVHMTTARERSLNVSFCDCEVGRFRRRSSTACEVCLEGQTCDFGSAEENFAAFGGDNLQVPLLQLGYYTTASDPLSVFECKPEDLCPGGIPETCLGETTGFLCFKCFGDMAIAPQNADGCAECSATSSFLVVLCMLAAFTGMMVTYYLANDILSTKASVELTASVTVGLSLTALQVFSILQDLSIPWPSSSTDYFSSLSFLVLNLDGLKLTCTVGTDAASNYFLRILTPFAMGGCLAVGYGLSFVACRRRWEYNKVCNTLGHTSQALFIAFVVISVRPFECYPHPNSESSVSLFPEVLCWTSDHVPLIIFAVLLFLLFLLPFAAVCVYGNMVAPSRMLSGDDGFPIRYRFLLYRFRPDVWWWGNVYVVRQTLLAFASSLPSGDPHIQIFYTIVTLTVYLGLVSRYWPWKNQILNVMDSVCCLLLIFVLLAGTAFVDQSTDQDFYAGLLTALVVAKWGFIFFGVCVVVYHARHGTKRELEEAVNAANQLNDHVRAMGENIRNSDTRDSFLKLQTMNAFDRAAMKEAVAAWGAGGLLLTRRVSDSLSESSISGEYRAGTRPSLHSQQSISQPLDEPSQPVAHVDSNGAPDAVECIQRTEEEDHPEDGGKSPVEEILIIDEAAVEDHCCTSIPKSSFQSGLRKAARCT